MKFAEVGFDAVLAGQKAAKVVEFTLPSAAAPISVGLVPLSMGEEVDVARKAKEFAADPTLSEGDAVYDYGVAVHTLLVAARDPSKPADRFFDSVEQVLSLPRELAIYLHEHQQQHQDQLSPWRSRLTMEQMFAGMYALADGGSEGDLFFIQLRPGTRLTFARFMAVQCKISLDASFSPGSLSGSTTTNSPTNTESPEAAPVSGKPKGSE